MLVEAVSDPFKMQPFRGWWFSLNRTLELTRLTLGIFMNLLGVPEASLKSRDDGEETCIVPAAPCFPAVLLVPTLGLSARQKKEKEKKKGKKRKPK